MFERERQCAGIAGRNTSQSLKPKDRAFRQNQSNWSHRKTVHTLSWKIDMAWKEAIKESIGYERRDIKGV